MFALINNQYELTIEVSKSYVATEWLEAQGCRFDRYISVDKVRFVFVAIADAVVTALTKKYAQPEAPVTESVNPQLTQIVTGWQCLILANAFANMYRYASCVVESKLIRESSYALETAGEILADTIISRSHSEY